MSPVSRPVSGDWFDFDMRKVGYEAVPIEQLHAPAP